MVKTILTKPVSAVKQFLFGGALKQEQLLRLALRERGLDDSLLTIEVDHVAGKSIVGDKEVGIVYPDSIIQRSGYEDNKKTISFYFNGMITEDGARQRLLQPFVPMPAAEIIHSVKGRLRWKKSTYNKGYWSQMAAAQYCLCPHHTDWSDGKELLWTYRFIETALVRSVPILFAETPLSEEFTRGFNYLWDREILSGKRLSGLEYRAAAEENRLLAIQRFRLPDSF